MVTPVRAVLFISHGSRSPQARREAEEMARVLEEESGLPVVEYAFLDVERPGISEGVEACVRRGASEIVIVLNFLNSGNHVLVDIPAILEEERKKHPSVRFIVPPHVGRHPGMKQLFLEIIQQALEKPEKKDDDE